jgi:succinate-semialdehyde dehydrogenase/glutarate-semialdehyde dehydrogenase
MLIRKFSSHNDVPKILVNKDLWQNQGFINGVFVGQESSDRFEVKNPANGQILTTFPNMGESEVDQCIKASVDSWQVWKNTTSRVRSHILMKMAQLMMKNQDDLARIVTLEAGKPFAEAKGEIAYGASYVEWYAEEVKRVYGDITPSHIHGRHLLTIKQPVGPTAMITPWNFPSAMIARKVFISTEIVKFFK